MCESHATPCHQFVPPTRQRTRTIIITTMSKFCVFFHFEPFQYIAYALNSNFIHSLHSYCLFQMSCLSARDTRIQTNIQLPVKCSILFHIRISSPRWVRPFFLHSDEVTQIMFSNNNWHPRKTTAAMRACFKCQRKREKMKCGLAKKTKNKKSVWKIVAASAPSWMGSAKN